MTEEVEPRHSVKSYLPESMQSLPDSEISLIIDRGLMDRT